MNATPGSASDRPARAPRTVALFGTYHPQFQKAGNSTTGFSILWASLPDVARVVVIASTPATLPTGTSSAQIELRPLWRLDSGLSLLRALAHLVRRRREFDLVVFNIHLTSFGRRPWVNALGLTLPRIYAVLSRRRTVVYLHHLLESQVVEELGYRPSRVARWLVRRLELGLLRTTEVVVPLESQRTAVRSAFGRDVRVAFPTFVEAVSSGMVAPSAAAPERAKPSPTAPLRVLLFGYWGPQKELEGVLEDLAVVAQKHRSIRVTVAGEVNVNFPEFADRLRASARALDPTAFRFVGAVPEAAIGSLFREHDVLVLPYRATGGYSGAMNLAVPTGIGLVAYDLPQLRETARSIGVPVAFVPPRDPEALGRALSEAAAFAPRFPDAWSRARAAARQVLFGSDP